MNALPGLTTTVLGHHWTHFQSIGSTNDYCKEHGGRLPHGFAATADEQTAGKGRRGRQWTAAPGDCMALSVVLHGLSAGDMGPLPLLVGLAVCEGVEALSGVRCSLKWSNDVLIDGHKLCGILCESRISMEGNFAVAGMGVNLRQGREALDRLGLVYATSLWLATDRLYAHQQVAAAILNHLEPLLDQLEAGELPALMDRYRRRCVTLGKTVRVLWDGEERTGQALDIAEDGALLCRIDGQVRAVHAGEASVRGLYGYG